MKNLFKALASFQQEVKPIHEGTKGYGYTYADLKTIFEAINPILKKNKLGFTQLLEGDSIKTIIFHTESGETLESVTNIPQDVTLKGMNTFQVMGSAITYYRRYSLSAALGLVTDVDADAKGEQTQKTQPKPQPKPKAKREVTPEKYQEFVDKVKAKELTVEQIKQHYALSETREKALNELVKL
jgi:hypothetical protein